MPDDADALRLISSQQLSSSLQELARVAEPSRSAKIVQFLLL
jgi:hypothetical protein